MTTLLCADHVQYEDGTIRYLKAPEDHPSLVDGYPLYDAVRGVLANPAYVDVRILMIDHGNQDFLWFYLNNQGKPVFANHRIELGYSMAHRGVMTSCEHNSVQNCMQRAIDYAVSSYGMKGLSFSCDTIGDFSKRRSWLFMNHGPINFYVKYKAGELKFPRRLGNETYVQSVKHNEPVVYAYAVNNTVFIVSPTRIRIFKAVHLRGDYVALIREYESVYIASAPIAFAENSIMYGDGSVWDLSDTNDQPQVSRIFWKPRKSAMFHM
jgi:hypothetical protein